MAVTALMYGLAMKSAFNKEIDLDSDAIKVMLVTSAYTPSQDAHQYNALTDVGDRPEDWLPAVNINGQLNVRVVGQDLGMHRVWIRVITPEESAVFIAGDFQVI